MSLYEIRDLRIDFPTRLGTVEAVRGVTFEIGERECVALVGESGCGKSVTARALMGLTEAAGGRVRPGGSILCAGEDILGYSERQWRAYRGSRAAIIFQDAMTALNPTMRIGRQIWECCLLHRRMSRREAREQAVSLLERVGIPQPRQALDRYPHEFSGGMRQRVVIAQALACGPALLIADEPTTALDVTIQAQILELLQELREREGNSILLITHDLGVVAEMCTRVIVMYAGKIVEEAPVEQLFASPTHPYTQGLIASVPKLGSGVKVLPSIPGSVPDLASMPKGCRFAPRCKYATEKCHAQEPALVTVGENQRCRCWLKQEG